MVLDTSLLNTQQYKVRIKGRVEQSRERSSALLGVVALETTTYIYIYIYMCVYVCVCVCVCV